MIQPLKVILPHLQAFLQRVLNLALGDKEPTWGLVITLSAFTGVTAAERLRKGEDLNDSQALTETLTEAIMKAGRAWLLAEGGWEQMPQVSQQEPVGREQLVQERVAQKMAIVELLGILVCVMRSMIRRL